MQRRPYAFINTLFGQHHVDPHVLCLAAAVQASDCLFVQFQRPRQRHEHHVAAAVLEVQTVAGRLGMHQQQFDLAGGPPFDHVLVFDGLGVREAPAQFGQWGLGGLPLDDEDDNDDFSAI